MVIKCPNCGSENIDKKILGSYDHNFAKYIDVKLSCNVCGHSVIRKVTKDPMKKLVDEPDIDIKPLVAAAESPLTAPMDEIITSKKGRSKIFTYIKLTLFYMLALLIGIFVEVLGIFVERTMMMLELPALIGFSISLTFFLIAPILVVGAFVYRFRKKPFEGLFIGALSIPVTMFLIYYLRRFQWNYLEQLHEIYDALLPL